MTTRSRTWRYSTDPATNSETVPTRNARPHRRDATVDGVELGRGAIRGAPIIIDEHLRPVTVLPRANDYL